ncbi:hypothetical protein [Bradyrhizobium sp. NFR13]|uniref:hypothetical protein n=1 Tax=Bradyrhizobium sp. NFR13 TaxID=1566285 RepID=UPI0015874842|nr:hypothetical protein [Bradyrhizobium sp. NFR13]
MVSAFPYPRSPNSPVIRPSQTIFEGALVTACVRFWTKKEQQIEQLRFSSDELGASLELGPIGVQASFSNENGTPARRLDEKPRKIQPQCMTATRLSDPYARILAVLSGARPRMARTIGGKP